jgi:hypothetical protein
MANPLEQRNGYKGVAPRAWVRVRLVAPNGSETELELMADTGNPYPLIISMALMGQFSSRQVSPRRSHFGPLIGGWLHLRIPDVNFDQQIMGFANDAIVATTQASCPDFQGLAGLPLLRMVEYGGDPYWFWIRPAIGVP